MKKALSLSLLLSAITIVLPSLAMEKENPLRIKDTAAAHAAVEKAAELHKKYRAAVNDNNYDETLKALEAGAAVDIPDENGNTPLHIAMKNGNFKIIDLLLRSLAYPSAQNNFSNFPIFYLNEKMHFTEQAGIIQFITKKIIHDHMFAALLEKKIIKSPKEIKNYDDLYEVFHKKIGQQQKTCSVKDYSTFLVHIVDFILAAIPNHPGDVVAFLHLDLSLPYRDSSLAQQKANHLITIVKVMNAAALNYLQKPLIMLDDNYKACFGKLARLKAEAPTTLASVYIAKLKDIVDHPDQYQEEVQQQMRVAYEDYQSKQKKDDGDKK